MIVLSIIVGLSCCIDNSDALDYESNKINFNPDEVRVVRSSVELEPLTTISSGEKIYVYEKTGYTNYKINGNDTDKDNFIVSAALRDSGVVITTEKKGYRIDFNTDDTYGTTPPSQIGITIGSITTIPEASFSKTGYTMIGWNTSSIGNGVDIEPGQLTLMTSIIETCFGDNDAITLYPKWDLVEYSISFNNNDGIGDPPSDLSSVTIDSGANIPGVGITKTGYQATIWNTSPNGNGVDISPGQLSLTGPLIESCFGNDTSVILYPKWSEKEYRMLFTAEDVFGTIPDPLLGITINTSINLPGASFSRTGYDMVAWNTRNDSTGDSLQIGDITANASFLEQFFASNTELTLYPVWSAKTYSVSLSTERGTIAEGLWVKNGDSYKHDYTIESETFQMPSVESDDRFYDFICWEDQNGNTVSSIAKGSSGDLALHAVWAPREYTMNININGRMVSQICTLDSVLEDPECEEGFQFVGWFFKDQEGKETEFTSMSQMSEGMSIYAVFEPIKDDPVTMAASAIILVAFFSAVMFFSFRKR